MIRKFCLLRLQATTTIEMKYYHHVGSITYFTNCLFFIYFDVLTQIREKLNAKIDIFKKKHFDVSN